MTSEVEQADVGSSAWLTAIYAAHVDAAFNVAHRIVWNRADAQDVVQIAFVRAVTRADQLRDPLRTRSWLLSIVYREALNLVRRRREVVTNPTDFATIVAKEAGPEEQAVAHDQALAIQDAIAQLPLRLRLAFVLRDVEELPIRDVAAVLGIGESAVKMRVTRARDALRGALKGRL